MKRSATPVIESKELLSDNYYHLYRYTCTIHSASGDSNRITREVYDRGNGAAILLYNIERNSVFLIRQFRLPVFVNQHPTGMLLEACAGLFNAGEADPLSCIRRETMEETGFDIPVFTKLFEAYMSPGSVTEKLYFFAAACTDSMRTGTGGGLAEEEESIELIELPFSEALAKIRSGEIEDAKTIMLLQYAQLNQLLKTE